MSAVATLNAAAAVEASSLGCSSSSSGAYTTTTSDLTAKTTTAESAGDLTPADDDSAPADACALNTVSTTAAIPICHYFLRGMCRFGDLCRFSHDLSDDAKAISAVDSDNYVVADQQPSTSRKNWINAPVFVPGRRLASLSFATKTEDDCDVDNAASASAMEETHMTWADIVGGGSSGGGAANQPTAEPGSMDMLCPYDPCPFGVYCAYAIHLELCEMCDQFCLHPTDQAQRRKHNQECLQQHEQAMELSFAIARSKDKTCGICFDTIMEKSGREKRFGILPNCNHIFCLECIRKWRQAKQFEHKITRSCPECRVSSDFVCPSAFWVETKEEKDKLLNDYRSALGIKDCKYFKKGEGKCPFGNKCFYKHALPDGKLVDVGCPKRARKLQRATNEFIDLLDIYLWEFVDQRDYHWLDFLTSSSDESDVSDWSEE